MDLRRLTYFVAAAEEENFHRAAARLDIAQSALSKQIAALEAELGCALFDRVRRRVRLSAAGRSFLRDVRQLLRELDLAAERARLAARGQLGALRLGFRETAGRAPLLSQAVSQFRASYPEVEVRLTQMTSPGQRAALRAGELDAGFIYLPQELDPDLDAWPIAEDRFYLAIAPSHPLVDRSHIELADLTAEPFIWLSREKNAYFAERLMRQCLQAGLTPRIVQEADSEATILNLVATGMAVAFIVSGSPQPWLPGVVFKPVVGLYEVLTLALVWQREQPSPATLNFVELLKSLAPKRG